MRIRGQLVSFACGVAVGVCLLPLPKLWQQFRESTTHHPERVHANPAERSRTSELLHPRGVTATAQNTPTPHGPMTSGLTRPPRHVPTLGSVRANSDLSPRALATHVARERQLPPPELETSRVNEPLVPKAVASVDVPPAPPVPSTFTPIGYVEKPGGQVEAIILQDSQVYVVHIGERFADKYRVLKISPDSVEAVEDMPAPPAPLENRGSDSIVLRADLVRPSSIPDGPVALKSPASVKGPSATPAPGAISRRQVVASGTPREGSKAKAAAPSSALAEQPLGYVEKANGHVDTVVADGGTVRLVPQAQEAVTVHNPAPASVPMVRLMAKGSVTPPPIPEERVAENEVASGPPAETPTQVSEIPAQPGVREQPATVSGPTARSLLDPSEQVLAAPSPNLWMNQVRTGTNPVRISEVESPETPSFSPAPTTTTLKPLGFIERADGELDAVVSKDDDVFVVRQGETFGERFRAVRVSHEAVEVAEVSSPQGLVTSIPLILPMPDLLSFDFSTGPSPPDMDALGLGTERENAGNAEVPVTRLALEANPLAAPAKSRGSPPGHGVGTGHLQMKSRAAEKPSPEAATLIFQTLGSIETSNGEIEAIVAGGSEVYLVKQGERFADRYMAVSVEAGLVLAVRAPPGNEGLLSGQTDSREKPASKKLAMRNQQPSVVSRLVFDKAVRPPHPPAPLPQRGEGRVNSLALAPLGERVAGRGVLISRCQKGAPRSACRGGEGVLPIVNSNTGHHTSVSDPQAFQAMGTPRGAGLTDLGVTLFELSGFAGYDLQLHLAMADNPHDPF